MRRALAPLLVLIGVSLAALPAAAQNEADVAVTKQASPEPVTVGDDLVYTIVVKNNGPTEASQVTLTDTLSAEVSFGSATPSSGSCQETGQAVACDLGTIASGASSTVTIVVALTAPGTVSNTAEARQSGSDPNPTNDSATVQSTAEGSPCTQVGTWAPDTLTGSTGPDVLC